MIKCKLVWLFVELRNTLRLAFLRPLAVTAAKFQTTSDLHRMQAWVEACLGTIIAEIKCKLVWLFVELRNTLRLVFLRPFFATTEEFQTTCGLHGMQGWVEACPGTIIAVIKCNLVWLFVEMRNTLWLVFPRPHVATAADFQTTSGLYRMQSWVKACPGTIIAVIKCKLVWLFVELRNTVRLAFPRPYVATAAEFQTASGLHRRLQEQTWLVGWLVHLYYYWIPCFYLDFWRTPSKACKKRSNKCEWMKDK